MYINSAYINTSLLNYKDTKHALSIIGCGNYKLITKEKLPTYRPHGRLDYQLIYIASGQAHFFFTEKEETIVSPGTFILYRPKEFQKYVYYGPDKTEAFWIHFSGTNVKAILRQYGIKDDMRIIKTGSNENFINLFSRIIEEINQKNVSYENMVQLYFEQLLIQISRNISTIGEQNNSFIKVEIEKAQKYFMEHYMENINIDEYAASHNMSISWFIRSFKSITGVTPLQCILNQRMNNAQILLETTDYSINEISAIIGYDNQLYFSRLFKKQKGMSPKKYRDILRRQ